MNIFKVVISYMCNNMHYMYERAAYAMTAGQAVDSVFNALDIDRTRIYSLKIFAGRPDNFDDFSHDAKLLPVIGSDMALKDIWSRKYGEY